MKAEAFNELMKLFSRQPLKSFHSLRRRIILNVHSHLLSLLKGPSMEPGLARQIPFFPATTYPEKAEDKTDRDNRTCGQSARTKVIQNIRMGTLSIILKNPLAKGTGFHSFVAGDLNVCHREFSRSFSKPNVFSILPSTARSLEGTFSMFLCL